MKKIEFISLLVFVVLLINSCKSKPVTQPAAPVQKEVSQHKGLVFPYIGDTKPEDFHVTVKCAHFKRTASGTQVDLIVSNPDTVNYPAIYISVIGVNKKGLTEKIVKVVFNNVKANSTIVNTVYLPSATCTVECPITGYD